MAYFIMILFGIGMGIATFKWLSPSWLVEVFFPLFFALSLLNAYMSDMPDSYYYTLITNLGYMSMLATYLVIRLIKFLLKTKFFRS